MRKKLFMLTLLLFTSITLYTIKINANENNVIVKYGNREEKVIALTFDDGPHPTETNEVLDVLKKYDVKATFFIAGKHAKWYPQSLVRAHNEGHEIGNHTYNHLDISKLSLSQIEKEIMECESIVQNKIGIKTNLFRPPFGSYREKELINLAQKLQYKIVLWTTIDVKDWSNPGAQKIADTIINKSKNGDIILLHDYETKHTVQALDIFIPKMIENGYKFVTVSDLIK